jgi:hypothetical protein
MRAEFERGCASDRPQFAVGVALPSPPVASRAPIVVGLSRMSSEPPIPVIDMWAPVVPSREIMAHMADHFPLPQLGYLRVFFKTEPAPDTFRRMAPALVRDDADILADSTRRGSRRR